MGQSVWFSSLNVRSCHPTTFTTPEISAMTLRFLGPPETRIASFAPLT